MSLIRLTLLLVFLAGLLACQPDQPDQPATVPDMDLTFELVDETGRGVTHADYEGQLRLVFFGFTSCPDICPITLSNVAAALQSMGDLAEQITVLFVSIDPHRDSPELLEQYTQAFHPSVVGLTGSYEQLEKVTKGFRTTFGFTLRDGSGQDRPLSREEYETLADSVHYLPFHSSQVYVISAGNELVDIIGYGAKPDKIAATLRSHLR